VKKFSIPLIFAVLSLTTAGPSVARPPEYRVESPPRVSVDFLVAGRPLPVSRTRDENAFVSVPRWGAEYEIRITNHERRDRVLFVIGVDGLSIMDGSRASQQSGGYVLDPGESARIRGWRRGLDHVAAFTFTARGDSYAGRTGRTGHIGEIWVWAIREQSWRPPPTTVTPRIGNDQEKAAGSAMSRRGETGTGYGEELVDRVRTTKFIRSNSVRYLGFRYGLRPDIYPYRDDEARWPPGNFTPPPPGWKHGRE
jgi:hypothetical protein